MTTPRQLASFGCLVAAALVLDAVDYARLRWQTSAPRAARCNGGKAPRDVVAYEYACEAFCCGASHA